MSYYQVLPTSYWRNPGPVYGPGGDYGAPVPGCGVLPNMAGPARLGVGAVTLDKVLRKTVAPQSPFGADPEPPVGCAAGYTGKKDSSSPTGYSCYSATGKYTALEAPAPSWAAGITQAQPPQPQYVTTLGPGVATIAAKAATAWAAKAEAKAAAEKAAAEEEEGAGVPWWVWLAVPVVAGGGLALAYNMGWVGGKS